MKGLSEMCNIIHIKVGKISTFIKNSKKFCWAIIGPVSTNSMG
jgi:hypothetical protein